VGRTSAPLFRVVGEYWDAPQAEMVVALLKSEGIPGWLSRNESLTLSPHPNPPRWRPPVAVSVPAADLERARDILGDMLFGIGSRELGPGAGGPEPGEAAWSEAEAGYEAERERAQREAADARARAADQARRYEAMREQIADSVRSRLRTPEERQILEHQAGLPYPELVVLGKDAEALSDVGHAVHRMLIDAVERALA